MDPSGTALSNPQGQPEHTEYHGVSYPHRCHWIVITKVIVQGSIIPDVLVGEPGQKQGHGATSITDRLPFSETLQTVIEEHDERQCKVLAILYPSMITAGDLLREVEGLLVQARERSERHVENVVYQFMRVWVLSGHLTEPFLS